MPNGTVVEVRSGHLPDGSFVQTFTDVTKRREAQATWLGSLLKIL